MLKRIKSTLPFFLIFALVFSSVTTAWGAPGDIIHTGLKRIYKDPTNSANSAHHEALLQDIRQGADLNQFFQEDEHGQYFNIVEREREEFKAIVDLLKANDIPLTPEAIQAYIQGNLTAVENELAVAFDKVDKTTIITADYLEYGTLPKAMLLSSSTHYGVPEAGSQTGSTRLATAALPSGATKWRIKTTEEPIAAPNLDSTSTGYTDYVSGSDILILSGQYVVLLATNASDQIKGYANLPITADQIKAPPQPAEALTVGTLEKGSLIAGTVKLTELREAETLWEEATQWRIKIQDMPFTGIPSYNTSLSGTQVYNGEEIILLNESSLHPIPASFTKYMVLLATDASGAIKGYQYFTITSEHIAPAPIQLVITTNYQSPVAGTSDGTTKFTGLHKGISPVPPMTEATQWRIKVQNAAFAVPAANSTLSDPQVQPDISTSILDNIPIVPGQSLLLTATDSTGAIKGYRLFNQLSSDQIRGQTSPQLQLTINYSQPEAGTLTGTTRITSLKFDGVSGNPTNWRYRTGMGLTAPILDSVVSGTTSYIAGNNISIAGNQDLLLLATDATGKVKAYQLFPAGTFTIREPAAMELQQITHYSLPVKGSEVHKTKIELLTRGLSPTYPLSEATQWQYKVQAEPFIAPELNSTLSDTASYTVGDNITAQSNQYLLILASDSTGKIKGYKSFLLTAEQVRAPKVPELLGINYSAPEPGTQSGTTRISTLALTGLSGVTGWRYKVQQSPFISQDIPELNTTVAGALSYSAGANILVSEGQSLLLVAVDSSGRAKAYKFFNSLAASQIKPPDAAQLAQTTHYSLPQPGTAPGTTRINVLSFGNPAISGAVKWHVKVLSQSAGVLALDSTLDGINAATPVYSPGSNIPAAVGQRLLLLATDADGKIKAYKEFVLDSSHIQGSPAPLLNTPPLVNYENQAGSAPGTTKFTNLQFYGLSGASQWRFKVQNSAFEAPALDSILTGASVYTPGADIALLSNQYLILLATDSGGKIKGYAAALGSGLQIKAYAPLVTFTAAPGDGLDTTKLTGPTPPSGTSWQILLLHQAFATPALDEVLGQTPAVSNYTLGTDLSAAPSQFAVLLATDGQNRIKGFGMLQLEEHHLKNTTAVLSLPSQVGDEVAESSILLGGVTLEITLGTNAVWASDIRTNPLKRNALFDGLQAASEAAQWAKVVQALKTDGQGSLFRTDNQKVTIYLPQTSGYDISAEQRISLMVPAIALTGGQRPVTASGAMLIKPTITATLSGTVLQPPLVESDIRSGGKTLVVDLVDGNWVGNVATDTTLRNAVFDGLQVVGSENLTQWAKVVHQLKSVGTLIRTSGTRITITLPPVEEYALNFIRQNVRLVIPKEAVEDANGSIVATPTFTVLPDTLQVNGVAATDRVFMTAPDQKVPRGTQNFWLLTVDRGTLKETIALGDLVITGLPQGLTAAVTKVGSQQIRITLSGTAAAAITTPLTPSIRIKGIAVTEPGSIDSPEISLKLEPGTSLLEDLKNVKLHVAEKRLMDTTAQMEYSVNSTTGLNGTWYSCTSPATENVAFITGKVFVREKLQPGVFWEVGTLSNSPAPIVAIEFTAEPGKIKLAGVTTDMEYSLDGGTAWTTITEAIASKVQTLDVSSTSSDLRVRIKATANTLPSLATAKLNGIHLGSVTLNVAGGKILGTTIEMQYSLNSANGLDGTWTNCTAPDTTVSFAEGLLYVREKSKVNNFRLVGQIYRELVGPDTGSIGYHVAQGTITVGENTPNLEYRIGTNPWASLISGTTNGSIAFVPSSLEFRYRATHNTLPSPVSQKAIILAPASAPAVAADDVDAVLTKLNPSDQLEYRIGTGSWISWPSSEASISFPPGVTNVAVRTVATETLLASQAASFTFVPKLDLTGTGVNVAAGQLTGTTTAMEYSLDSTNGTNGTWVSCTSPNTNVTFVEGKVYVREKIKPRNYLLVAAVARRATPDLTGITYHVAHGTISIPSGLKNILQYRIGGAWRDLDAAIIDPNDAAKLMATGISFQPGSLEFRARGTATLLPSQTVAPVPPIVIPAVPAAPAFSYNDVDYVIAALTDQYEYRINNGSWILGSIRSEFTGTDKVSIRKAATPTTLAGLEQLISFIPNLNLYTVGINAATSQITNTTTAMEYSLTSTDGIDGSWIACTASNTTVANLSGMVYVREKAKPKNYRRVTATVIQKRPSLSEPEKAYISFDVSKGTILVTNGLGEELQYRSGNGAWTHLAVDPITTGVQFQQGDLLIRRKATIDQLASDPVIIATVPAPAAAPTLIFNDLNNTITSLDATYEYRIGTGIWVSGPVDGGFTGNKTVAVRKKATQSTLPSLEQVIIFTDNIDLTVAGVNVASNQITGTTTAMEYSINSSDGVNGTWSACGNTNTNVTFIPGKVFIREKAYPGNHRQVGEIHLPASGPPISLDFAYDVAFGTITVSEALKNRLQYRFGDGSWANLGTESTTAGISFTPGKLFLRYKADALTLPSLAAEWNTLLAPASAPNLTFDDVVNDITWVTSSIYEYRIGTGPWTPASVPGDFNGTKAVQVRVKATSTALPSLIQTINFTANLDLSPVWVDPAAKKINGTTTAMEYSITFTDGSDGNWHSCSNATTSLPEDYINEAVYVRAKTQKENFRLVYPVTP